MHYCLSYMSLEDIISPVTLLANGKEREFENGKTLSSTEFDTFLIIDRVEAVQGRLIITAHAQERVSLFNPEEHNIFDGV